MKSVILLNDLMTVLLSRFFHFSHSHGKVTTFYLSCSLSLSCFYSSTSSIVAAAYSPLLCLPLTMLPHIQQIFLFLFFSLGLALLAMAACLFKFSSHHYHKNTQMQTHTHTRTHTPHTSLEGKQIIRGQENCFVWFTLVCLFSPPFSLPPSPSLSLQQMGYFNEISLACSHLCEK